MPPAANAQRARQSPGMLAVQPRENLARFGLRIRMPSTHGPSSFPEKMWNARAQDRHGGPFTGNSPQTLVHQPRGKALPTKLRQSSDRMKSSNRNRDVPKLHGPPGQVQMRKHAMPAFHQQPIVGFIEWIFRLRVKRIARGTVEYRQEHVVDRGMIAAAPPYEPNFVWPRRFGEGILREWPQQPVGELWRRRNTGQFIASRN